MHVKQMLNSGRIFNDAFVTPCVCVYIHNMLLIYSSLHILNIFLVLSEFSKMINEIEHVWI